MGVEFYAMFTKTVSDCHDSGTSTQRFVVDPTKYIHRNQPRRHHRYHSITRRYYHIYCILSIVLWFRKIDYVASQDDTTSAPPTQSPSSTQVPQSVPSSSAPFPVPPSTIAPSSLLQTPTQIPSKLLTTLSPLTLEPTKNLITVQSPLLSMTLINMEQDVTTNNETRRQFRNLTSHHVRRYWNMTSQQYKTPFFIGRVVTSILSERRTNIQPPQDPFIVNSEMILPNSSTNNTNQSTVIWTIPSRLEIVYTQTITYLEQPTGEASFFNFQVSDIFTIPFVHDGQTFTTDLRSLLFNELIIFLDYSGVVVEEEPVEPVLSDPRDRNLIITVVTLVVVVLLAACLYINYLLQRRTNIDHDTIKQSERGIDIIDDHRNGPELLRPMNQSGELPLLIPPVATTVVVNSTATGAPHQMTNNHQPISISNHENVIVSECYDEEYPLSGPTTAHRPHSDDPLLPSQNVAGASNQPTFPPFLPPLSSMDSRHISNITEPTSWSSENVPRSALPVARHKNSIAFVDRGSPLRITTSNSRDFDSEPFMLNPLNIESNHMQLHQPSMIGTPSQYGMVTTAIPSTVSDLDMNETPLMSDFQDSPLPPFRRNSEDNHIQNGAMNGYEGYGGSNHNTNNNIDPEYVQPPSTLVMGLPVLEGGGVDENMLDHHHQQQQHHYSPYPHEPDVQQQHTDMYHDNTVSYDDYQNMPLMTGFQLEIQDLE